MMLLYSILAAVIAKDSKIMEIDSIIISIYCAILMITIEKGLHTGHFFISSALFTMLSV